jgi:protein-S-isoprenylcysteine O-methyltransferase Ste14
MAAFVALPGIAAFAMAVAIGSHHPLRDPPLAAALLSAGSAFLPGCVREFYIAWRATLAPWAPPAHRVMSGPYRMSGNPLYVGDLTRLAGRCALRDLRTLVLYGPAVLGACHLRVRRAEAPWAARRFGAIWQAYRARVPRRLG